jgi:hypothetical protein
MHVCRQMLHSKRTGNARVRTHTCGTARQLQAAGRKYTHKHREAASSQSHCKQGASTTGKCSSVSAGDGLQVKYTAQQQTRPAAARLHACWCCCCCCCLTRLVSLRRLHSLLASMSRAFIFHFSWKSSVCSYCSRTPSLPFCRCSICTRPAKHAQQHTMDMSQEPREQLCMNR